jgi:hypothetical protein
MIKSNKRSLVVLLDDETHNIFKLRCYESRKNMSEVARELIKEHIKEKKFEFPEPVIIKK